MRTLNSVFYFILFIQFIDIWFDTDSGKTKSIFKMLV